MKLKSYQGLSKRMLILRTILLINSILLFTGCEVVGGIFKAGMVWGIFLVVAIVAAIIYLISRGKRN
jgi:hypothetical protein